MNFLRKILPHLKNKYVAITLTFIVWISFFDTNNLITSYQYRKQLNELEEYREYYQKETKKNVESLALLMESKENLEKFAREKYLMKKDNEEIFLIVESSHSKED